MTALVTPFAGDGVLDLPALERLARRQIEAGIEVLVPLGTTGETATLDEEEQRAVLGAVRRTTDGPILAGAGTNDTRTTVERCRMVAGEGADFALVVGPYYNKPPQAGFIRHFERVADESPVPVVLYNVPSRTGSNMAAETQLALAAHPNIVGVKEASGDLQQVAAVIAGRPEGFVVLSGDDALTLPIVEMGGDGVVSVAANVVPAEVARLTHAALEGDLDGARATHRGLEALFEALFIETNPIPVKAALAEMGLCSASTRSPLADAAPATREAVRSVLVAGGVLDDDRSEEVT